MSIEHMFYPIYPNVQSLLFKRPKFYTLLSAKRKIFSDISKKNVNLRVLGFTEKCHVFLDLFGSGSGTLRVSKSQTCPALSLLSRVFISGSRVLRNPVAHVKTNQCSFYLKMIFHAIDEKNHVIFTCCNFTNFLIQS